MNHKYDIKELSQIVKGEIISISGDREVYNFSIDSRKIVGSENLLFIAIKGAHNDAHNYILNSYKKGVRNFILQYIPEELPVEECSIIKVHNSLKALQDWMASHRSKFNIPVLGITGSNGKTTVKEWLNLMLAEDYAICRSPNSYNSQVGVPLSVSNLNKEAQLGIFEAGISMPNEMEKLERIIQPTLGMITNIGNAHRNNFNSEEQLIREKSKLFNHCEIVFASDKNSKLLDVLRNQKGSWSLWGTADKADLKIIERVEGLGLNKVRLEYNNYCFDFEHEFRDEASFENMMFCILFLLHLGYEFIEIQARISRLKSLPMRMEILKGQKGLTIINDAYTLDINSLEIALEQLDYQSKSQGKIVLLSDIDSSNDIGSNFYKELKSMLYKHKVDLLIGIGPEFIRQKKIFSESDLFFESKEQFLDHLDLSRFENKTVLVKGSRTKEFERIVQRLQRKNHRTILEINLASLAQNLKYFKSLLQPKVKLMVMVKAFSYGAGVKEIAQVLEFNGVDYLGVAYADEGVELRTEGISIPIMVMNPEADNFDACFRFNLEPEIYSLEILSDYIARLPKADLNQKFKIHLKLDTGMNRLGFVEKDIGELISILKSNPKIEVAGMLTHLAASDRQVEDNFSRQQLDLFRDLSNRIKSELKCNAILHALNTSGILRFPNDQMDMVRLGIGLYGVSPNDNFQKHLIPVSTFKTRVNQIKEIEVGDTVGYNREFVATEKMKIAIIPVGYADGFPRSLSNGKGWVWINDKKATILGNVCMDMCMVDISSINCNVNDEVVLFSPEYSIKELAKSAHTISYEIMTSMSSRVRRVYVND